VTSLREPLSETEIAERDALAGRIFQSTIAALEIGSIYLGDRLGYYRALAGGGPATAAELASRTNTNERYTREWLEQQAVAGLLYVVSDEGDAATRRFGLPTGHAEALLDGESLAFASPFARFAVGVIKPMTALLEAYRTGGGVSWLEYGEDTREAQAGANQPLFLNLLGQEWLPAIPEVHNRLQAGNARVADIGCGAGWSSIGIARAYPNAAVDGFDLDELSIELARANAAQAGVSSRTCFEARDAGDPSLAGQYDLVAAFECVHDMSRPVDALRAMRRLVAPGGTVLVVDERVADAFTAPGDEVERLMYGWSILTCLPAGMAEQPSAATGTVMRAGTLRAYAQEAGFRDIEVLPIEHDFLRVYRLVV
jgi:SAM-dependent methyltransferase